jgi:hypothetical protein
MVPDTMRSDQCRSGSSKTLEMRTVKLKKRGIKHHGCTSCTCADPFVFRWPESTCPSRKLKVVHSRSVNRSSVVTIFYSADIARCYVRDIDLRLVWWLLFLTRSQRYDDSDIQLAWTAIVSWSEYFRSKIPECTSGYRRPSSLLKIQVRGDKSSIASIRQKIKKLNRIFSSFKLLFVDRLANEVTHYYDLC